MRCFAFILVFFRVFTGLSQQETEGDQHYKVRFCGVFKFTSANFNFKNTTTNTIKSLSVDFSESQHYEGNINSTYLIIPEVKVDFELPLFLKGTCGINYSGLNFKTPLTELVKTSIYRYYDHSVPGVTDLEPVGSSKSVEVVRYVQNAYNFESIGTYIGLGFCRGYKRFNFDADYTFSANKVVNGIVFNEYYDTSYDYLSTQSLSIMADYKRTNSMPLFAHNFSTGLSYRILKRSYIKLGYQYSKNYHNFDDRSGGSNSSYRNMHYHTFMVALMTTLI
jgi:hypothetical protein